MKEGEGKKERERIRLDVVDNEKAEGGDGKE
jgi:hypothetical protein